MITARASKGGLPSAWLAGLGCGALIMVNPATAMFGAALLVPSVLMRIADDRPERAGTRAVLLCNVAATIGPFCRLWHQVPPTMLRALDMLSNMTAVAMAWSAAGLGWLLSEAMIFLADRWLTSRTSRTLSRLDADIEELTAEWGLPSTEAGKAPL